MVEFDNANCAAYFRLVKGLLAILFSVVLIVSQTAASINGPLDLGTQKASARKCCNPCGSCNGSKCCVGDNQSNPEQPAPAAPSQGSSQNDLQVFASVALLVWEQNSTESARVPASFLAHASGAAPLYQRNCSYLI